MKFVIRDDDACAFTSPREIQGCYDSIWPEIPVSLSVTPYRIPGQDPHAPDHLVGSMDPMPLEQNVEFVRFLREGIDDGRVDITLHGYHHLCYDEKPEFIGGDNLKEKALKGKEHLENLFDLNIRTFVPPNNGIRRQGLDAISEAGMNLAGMLNLWSSHFRRVSFKSLSHCPSVWWYQKVRSRKYPFMLDLGDHKEIACHTVGPRSSYQDLRKELRFCHEVGGIFVLATHYHAFDRVTEDGIKVGKAVHGLIDMAAAFPGTQFVGFNSIW